jgi:hypothetical protein
MADRVDGPRFSVRTWQEPVSGCAAPLMWFARIVPVRPEAAPFTDEQDERQAVSTCPDIPRLTMDGAVEAAIEKWERIWGAAVLPAAAAPPITPRDTVVEAARQYLAAYLRWERAEGRRQESGDLEMYRDDALQTLRDSCAAERAARGGAR